jgi:hypothetical protein
VSTAAAVTAAPPLRPPYAGLWNSGRHIAAVVQAIAHCADLAAAVAAAAVEQSAADDCDPVSAASVEQLQRLQLQHRAAPSVTSAATASAADSGRHAERSQAMTQHISELT